MRREATMTSSSVDIKGSVCVLVAMVGGHHVV